MDPWRQQQELEEQYWYFDAEAWEKHREYMKELQEIINYRKREKHGYDKV